MKSPNKSVLAAFLGALALTCTLSRAQEATKPKASPRLDPALIAEFGGKKSATKGHRDSVMGFSLPTQVAEVLVKGGQEVPKGTLLVRGDDTEDLAVLKLQKLKSDSLARAAGQEAGRPRRGRIQAALGHPRQSGLE